MAQKIIGAADNYAALDAWLREYKIQNLLLVCDESIGFLPGISAKLREIEERVGIVRFSDFQPNPAYESAVKGVALFRSRGCDAIMAVGGGSAMDVAKCIKLYANMDSDGADGAFLKLDIVPNGIPFLGMPTTAGTGSEATRYAVVYFEGNKQSVTSASCIPGTVLMDPSTLRTLPLYQKKATMMDALCHAVESFWSVNSTEESKALSAAAVKDVLKHMQGYLRNEESGNAGMLQAAHLAGMAINITQTTAGHAMCYKLTSLFRVAHGHAAILCDRILFPWMIENTDRCVDPRGKAYLSETLDEIGRAMGCRNAQEGAEKLDAIFRSLELSIPSANAAQFKELRESVNPVRMKNHPVALDEATFDALYHQILEETT